MLAKARRQDLDRAKGLGITLVVLGHIVARTPPRDNEWFVVLHTALYQFHMPFFMYLSGYVTFLSGAARTPLAAWPRLVRSRAYRLLLPFLVFALVIVIGKIVTARFMHVDNLPSSLTQAIVGVLWDTDRSAAASVWYIAVLFIFCFATPLLLKLFANRTVLLLALAAVLYFLPVPHVMYLDRVATYYLFFVLGGLAADAGENWLEVVDRLAWWSLAAFLLVLISTFWFFDSHAHATKLLICGIMSIPALHGLVRRGGLSHSTILLTLGTFSFVIYLLNTLCIGLMKGLMLKVMPWDGPRFLVFAPCLLIAGVVGPILIKRWLLSRVPVLDRITD